MKHSEIVEKINGINVSFWSNFNMEKDFELQILKEPDFEFGLNSKGLQTFWKKS
jgi:hypothetical protein